MWIFFGFRVNDGTILFVIALGLQTNMKFSMCCLSKLGFPPRGLYHTIYNTYLCQIFHEEKAKELVTKSLFKLVYHYC